MRHHHCIASYAYACHYHPYHIINNHAILRRVPLWLLQYAETVLTCMYTHSLSQLRAMERALREHGTLTLSQAMRPAIELARDGFPVYDEMYARLIMNRDRMIQYEGTKNVFFTEPGAMPKKVGQVSESDFTHV